MKIITPTVSSFSAFLLPVFQSCIDVWKKKKYCKTEAETLTDPVTRKASACIANLLVPISEERLENLAAGNDRMPAHSGHPALQPLHAHLYKFLLKPACQGDKRAGLQDVVFVPFVTSASGVKAPYLSPACLAARGWGWPSQTCPEASHIASQSACICGSLGGL